MYEVTVVCTISKSLLEKAIYMIKRLNPSHIRLEEGRVVVPLADEQITCVVVLHEDKVATMQVRAGRELGVVDVAIAATIASDIIEDMAECHTIIERSMKRAAKRSKRLVGATT